MWAEKAVHRYVDCSHVQQVHHPFDKCCVLIVCGCGQKKVAHLLVKVGQTRGTARTWGGDSR